MPPFDKEELRKMLHKKLGLAALISAGAKARLSIDDMAKLHNLVTALETSKAREEAYRQALIDATGRDLK